VRGGKKKGGKKRSGFITHGCKKSLNFLNHMQPNEKGVWSLTGLLSSGGVGIGGKKTITKPKHLKQIEKKPNLSPQRH